MPRYLAFVLLMFISPLVNANEIDLSGTWELTASITEDDVPYTTTLVFEPTELSSEFGGTLYRVTGDLDGIPVKSASIGNVDGDLHLIWWIERPEGIDLESNMILNFTPDALSLGGDFERYEVATMKKISE